MLNFFIALSFTLTLGAPASYGAINYESCYKDKTCRKDTKKYNNLSREKRSRYKKLSKKYRLSDPKSKARLEKILKKRKRTYRSYRN